MWIERGASFHEASQRAPEVQDQLRQILLYLNFSFISVSLCSFIVTQVYSIRVVQPTSVQPVLHSHTEQFHFAQQLLVRRWSSHATRYLARSENRYNPCSDFNNGSNN